MLPYTYRIAYGRPDHEESNVSRNVVHQSKAINLGNSAVVLVTTQVGGEETTKLNQSVQTLQNTEIK